MDRAFLYTAKPTCVSTSIDLIPAVTKLRGLPPRLPVDRLYFGSVVGLSSIGAASGSVDFGSITLVLRFKTREIDENEELAKRSETSPCFSSERSCELPCELKLKRDSDVARETLGNDDIDTVDPRAV